MDRKVDESALKVNQAFIIGLLLLAFVLDLSLIHISEPTRPY